MPTSSINKNFIVSGEEQVKRFFDAIKESEQSSRNNEKDTFLSKDKCDEIKRIIDNRRK